MTELTPIEAHVLAYFAQGTATTLDISGRWFPHGELVMIIADKMQVATRKFGRKAGAATRNAATAFVDYMIEAGGWSIKQGEFGGSMHQFQADAFKVALKAMQDGDAVLASLDGGDWEAAFAGLGG